MLSRPKKITAVLIQALETGKLFDRQISEETWLKMLDDFLILRGIKLQQGHTPVKRYKPRGKSALPNIDQILKREAREKQLALARAALAEQKENANE